VSEIRSITRRTLLVSSAQDACHSESTIAADSLVIAADRYVLTYLYIKIMSDFHEILKGLGGHPYRIPCAKYGEDVTTQFL